MSQKHPSNDLKKEWYQKLEDSGFEDIEDWQIPDSPLKEWHSFKFVSEESQQKKNEISEHQEQIEKFLHHPQFYYAAMSISEKPAVGRNPKVSYWKIGFIWEMYIEGMTERNIAEQIKLSKTCIHGILSSLQEWMKYI